MTKARNRNLLNRLDLNSGTGFKVYNFTPFKVVAYKITDATTWHYKEEGRGIVVIDDEVIGFTHKDCIEVGDYIIYNNDRSILHCTNSRFKDTYEQHEVAMPLEEEIITRSGSFTRKDLIKVDAINTIFLKRESGKEVTEEDVIDIVLDGIELNESMQGIKTSPITHAAFAVIKKQQETIVKLSLERAINHCT